MIKEIIDKANRLGACRLTEGVTTWEALADLFFSPQGMEFCVSHGFPSPEDWEAMRPHAANLREVGVYLDAGAVSYEGDGNIALVGDTQGEIIFNRNDRVSRLLLLNGASAEVYAGDYAVVDILHDEASTDYVVTKDKTVVML